VKKTRRVELQIERREITVFAGSGGKLPQPLREGDAGKPEPRACPACGSTTVRLLAQAVASPQMDMAALQQGIEDGSVHLHQSPDGAWWVCLPSLHRS
jgi:hypothetical protein